MSAQENKVTNAQLESIKAKYKKAILDEDYDLAYSQAKEVSVRYENTYKFDSVLVYNNHLSELGRRLNDFQKEVKPLVDNLNIEFILTKGINNFESRVDTLYKHVDDTRLDPYTRSIICHHKTSSLLYNYQYDDAEIVILKAIKIGEEHDLPLSTRIDFQIFLAKVYKNQKRFTDCINALIAGDNSIPENSMPILESRIYSELFNIFLFIRDYDKAYEYANKSLNLGKFSKRKEIINEAHEHIGRVLRHQKKYEASVEYINLAIKGLHNSKFNRSLLTCHRELTEIYLEIDSLDQAKTYLDSMYFYRDYGEGKSYKHYYSLLSAKYNIKRGNLNLAEDYLAEIEDELSYKEYLFYILNKEKGNNQLALEYYENYISKTDSVKNSFQLIKVQHLESAYNRDKQNAEIENLNNLTIAQDKALAIRNTAIWMGSFMVLILGSLLFGLYRLYNRDKENQKELAIQNKQIKEALAQNQVLIKEIHHRVKNNLQVVSSLLSMQARKLKDGDTKDALNSSKTRVQSMSILHQNLYQGNDLTGVNIEEYLEKLVENIVDTYRISDNIKIHIDIDPISIDIDTLVPLGLIANELICNALKYAFKGREDGELSVSFKSQNDSMTLRVADNGVGFDGDELPIKKGSLGARLIKSFSERLEGKLILDKSNGTDISIVFDSNKL